MTEIEQAVKELREQLGRPSWLSAIAVGSQDGRPVIVLYLTSSWKPNLPFLENGWKGYPVVFCEFGSFAPLGGWKE
jgi:hypothetical protein